MPRLTAQTLGAGAGIVLTLLWVLWDRTRPSECPGAVTVEFHPPLTEAGSYRFQLLLDEEKRCDFKLSLPLSDKGAGLGRTGCEMAIELRTANHAARIHVGALTFAASPEKFRLQVSRNSEAIYDTTIEPKYAPYPTLRQENKRFCGERAFVEPACLRGTSACAPFPARCDGPEDCAAKKVCCVAPEWGREYGVDSASVCDSERRCLDQFGNVACHTDADCPLAMRCADSRVSREFRQSLTVCQNR